MIAWLLLDSSFFQPLPLFPTNGLDQSLHAPVLVGLVILTFFREALGWGYAGLVVPGYLATVFLAAPVTGALMVVEGLVGYFVSAAIGRWLPRAGAWSELFGRERFLLIILCALLTRLALEAYWVPLLVERHGFAHSRELYSIGLVLVPLLANTFWNAGVLKSLPRVAFITLLTLLFVDRVLLSYTNFTLSRFQIANESVSLAFLETPHAYIILVLGAVLAARDNVLYGWDYNGILVPALLAVAWYEPTKLLTTVAEALFVLFLSKRLAALPPFSKLLIVGSRRMLMAYAVGFVAKWALGFAALRFAPNLQTIDYFGFGYLLPSLLAIKMWNTDRVGRVLMPTLQVSLGAFLVGSLTSLLLGVVDPPPSARALGGGVRRVDSVALALLGGDSAPAPREVRVPWGERTLAQETLVIAAAVHARTHEASELSARVPERLDVARGPRDFWVITPRSLDANDDRLAPRVAVRPAQSSRPWLVVIDRPEVASAAAVLSLELAASLDARAVVVRSRLPGARELDDSFISALRESAAIESVLVVETGAHAATTLSVVGLVPSGLPVSRFEDVLGAKLAIGFRAAEGPAAPFANQPRLVVPSGVAEAAAARVLGAPPPEVWPESVRRAVSARSEALTTVLPGRFEQPSIEVLRLFQATLARVLARPAGTEPGEYERAFTGALGYRYARIGPESQPPQAFALFEPLGPSRRGQATLVLRAQARNAAGVERNALLVELPAPRYERGALGAALALYAALDADAFLLAGALPRSAPEQASDPRRPGGRQAHYQVSHETWLQGGGLALSVQGLAPEAELGADGIVAFQRATPAPEAGPPWTRPIARLLADGGFELRAVDGTPELETYSGALDPSMAYARRFGDDQMLLLWLSEEARALFAQREADEDTGARLLRVGITPREVSAAELGRAFAGCGRRVEPSGPCTRRYGFERCKPLSAVESFERYNQFRNPFELGAALAAAEPCRAAMVRDVHSQQLWAAVSGPEETWLVPFRPGPPQARREPLASELERAVALGVATLKVRGSP